MRKLEKRKQHLNKAHIEKLMKEKTAKLLQKDKYVKNGDRLERESEKLKKRIEEAQKFYAELQEEYNSEQKEEQKVGLIESSHIDIMKKARIENLCEYFFDQYITEIKTSDVPSSYFEKLTIEVDFSGSISTFEVKKMMTFRDLKDEVGSYYSIPPNKVFFGDENGKIFLDDMLVQHSLFPLETVKLNFKKPRISLILVRNNELEALIPMAQESDISLHDLSYMDDKNKQNDQNAEIEAAKEVKQQRRKKAIMKTLFGLLSLSSFICMAVFYILSCVQQQPYRMMQLMRDSYLLNFFTKLSQTCSSPDTTIYEFFRTDFAYALAKDNNTFYNHIIFLPYAELRQIRADSDECETGREELDQTLKELGEKCVPSFSIDKMSESDFGDLEQSYFLYHDDLDGTPTYRSFQFQYPSKGYVVELPILEGIEDTTKFTDVFDELEANSWIDSKTKAIIFSMNLMDPNNDIIFNYRTLFNFHSVGVAYPELEVYLLRTKMLATTQEVVYMVLVFIFSLAVLGLSIFELTFKDIEERRSCRCCKKLKVPNFYQIITISDFLTILLIYLSLIFKLARKKSLDNLEISDTKFVELTTYAFVFEALVSFDSFIFEMLTLSFLKYSSFLMPRVDFLTRSFKKYMINFITISALIVLGILMLYSVIILYHIGIDIFGLQNFWFSFTKAIKLFLTGSIFRYNTQIVSYYFNEPEHILKKVGYFFFLSSIIGFCFMAKYLVLTFCLSNLMKCFRETDDAIRAAREKKQISAKEQAHKLCWEKRQRILQMQAMKEEKEDKEKQKEKEKHNDKDISKENQNSPPKKETESTPLKPNRV